LKQPQGQTESPFDKQFLREQKRKAILSEAARLFNIHGARATRLSDVAESLNLNKATLYYYIKSKDDLIYQTYQASCEALEVMIEKADTRGEKGADKLAAFIRAYFDAWQAIMLGERPHFAILTEIRALKGEHRKQIAHRYSASYKRIKSFIHAGVADGSLRTEQETDAALVVFGLVQLSILWLPGIGPGGTDRAAEQFIDIVLHGIAANRASAGRDVPLPAGVPQSSQPDQPTSSRQAEFCQVGSAFFNRKGFKGTSLDEIADELAVTKGAFYYNVKDKDDLLRQCFERSLELMAITQARAIKCGGSGLQELQRCVAQLFAVQTGTSGPLIRFNLIPSLSAPQKDAILAGIEEISDRFGTMIDKGIADGSIRAVDRFIAEQLLMSAIDLSAELPWMRELGDADEACRSYFSCYFNGLSSAKR